MITKNGWAIFNAFKSNYFIYRIKSIILNYSTSILERYSLQEKIGTGKFSIVYRCVENLIFYFLNLIILKVGKIDEKDYAVKIIDKTILKPVEKEFIL